MCARFTLRKPPWPLAKRLGSKTVARTQRSRFNIAPTQAIIVALNDADRNVEDVRWGLVPPHAEHPSLVKLSTFNARIETVAKAPTYREAFRARRCAVFADGLYEWRSDADGGKTPLWIHRTDDQPFVFAGVWDVWHSSSSDETLTDLAAANAWLATGEADPAALLELLAPSPPEGWNANPVAPRVGNARFDDAALIAAVADTGATAPSLFD